MSSNTSAGGSADDGGGGGGSAFGGFGFGGLGFKGKAKKKTKAASLFVEEKEENAAEVITGVGAEGIQGTRPKEAKKVLVIPMIRENWNAAPAVAEPSGGASSAAKVGDESNREDAKVSQPQEKATASPAGDSVAKAAALTEDEEAIQALKADLAIVVKGDAEDQKGKLKFSIYAKKKTQDRINI